MTLSAIWFGHISFNIHISHSGREVSDTEIQESWMKFGSGTTIPEPLLEYFKGALKKHKTPSDLMKAFSTDGLTIPDICPHIPRTRLLLTVLKVLNSLSVRKSPQEKPPTAVQLTKDEIYILQYIGGYIIQRLKKRSRSPEEYSSLCGLVESENAAAVSPSSLIAVMQNRDFGSLTVPIHQLISFLKAVEIEFRKGYTHDRVFFSILGKLDFNKFSIMLQETITLDLLEKLCRFYLKIRCFQKARVLNSKYSHEKDQNVSQRKKLKSAKKAQVIFSCMHNAELLKQKIMKLK